MISLRSHFLLVVFIAAVIGLFALFGPTITGLAVLEPELPDLTLNLTKADYFPNEKINGVLAINLSGPIDESTKFIVKINNNLISEKPITQIIAFSELSLSSADKIESKIIADNPKTTKSITLNQDPVYLGFELTVPTKVFSIDMSLKGSKIDSSYPSELSMDFNLDGVQDWIYIGEPTTKSDKFTPSEFKDVVVESPLKPDIYNCRTIDLPLSKKFTVYSEFKKTNEGGNIKAAILKCEDPDCIIATPYTCDLFFESIEFQEDHCDIEIDTIIQGPNPVCVYTSQGASGTEYYKLKAERSGGVRYSPLTNPRPDYSTAALTNPHIKIKEWKHDKNIYEDSDINFLDWETGPSQHNEFPINETIDKLLKELYIYDPNTLVPIQHCNLENEICISPISITSKTPGILELSDLKLVFGSEEEPITWTQFFDVKIIPSLIHTINQTNLTKDGLIISLPLNFFNITAPPTTLANETFNLIIETSTKASASQKINVFSTETPDQTSLDYKISSSKSTLERLTSDPELADVITLFSYDLKTPLTSLTEYKLKLQEIDQSNKTQTEKEQELTSIESNVTDIISKIPSISVEKKIGPIETLISPSDITSQISTKDRQKLYLYQQNSVIKSESKVINIDSETKTLIKKIIKPKQTLTSLDIIEEIPKSIAQSASDIEIKPSNYQIISSDPIIKFPINTLSSETAIMYAVDGDKLISSQEAKTFLVPEVFPAEPTARASVCGDGVCTLILEDKISCPEDCKLKTPWAFIIILLILMVLGIIAIILYHKGYFEQIIVKTKKPKFKSPKDIENLVNYIQTAQKQGFKKQQITNALLKKGWTQSQIDYVFKIAKKKTAKKQTASKEPKEKKGFLSKFIKFKKEQPKKPKNLEKEIFPFLPPKEE